MVVTVAMRKDIIGKRFGRLIVTREFRAPSPNGKRNILYCDFVCDCGNKKTTLRDSLVGGKTLSCGCRGLENRVRAVTKHGETRTHNYWRWAAMLDRCRNPKNHAYARYGGRGIKVCKRWHDYALFLEDMGVCPSKKHSLDRIDTNGDYEPKNCRWVTPKEQGRNTRKNLYFEVDGVRKSLPEWCEIYKKEYRIVYPRVWNGWDFWSALMAPKGSRKAKDCSKWEPEKK